MHLSPKEIERLLLFLAAELARRRRARGLKLNYPEAYALIADEISEGARDGRAVAELMSYGTTILNTDDVEPGTEVLLDTLLVEAMFDDGQKLVCVHDPIRDGERAPVSEGPGEIKYAASDIITKEHKELRRIRVHNKGDRPIQVGSHYHFFEVNPALDFDRAQAFGFRLKIPAGTAMRFEPGDSRDVDLISFGGEQKIYGLAGLTEGESVSTEAQMMALDRAKQKGYCDDA